MLRGRVADADRNLRAATSFTDRGSPLWCRLQLLIGEFAEFTSMERALAHYSAALPASAGDRKGSIWGLRGHGCPGLGMAESGPCPLIAAGFCERAGGSQGRVAPAQRASQAPLTRSPGSGSCQAAGAGSPWWRCGSVVRGGGLSVRGDQPWRPGAGARSSQPYLGARGVWGCPGDMMIDRVSPACGDAAAQSNQAVRLALREQGRQRLTAARRELAAVVPIG